MHQHQVDEILSGSSPTFSPSIPTEAALEALVLETREASGGARWSRRRALWLVPTAVLSIGALTAGAAVVDRLSRVETPIPISYVTDTGTTVTCEAVIASSLFAQRFDDITDYYRMHDFTKEGRGQRIYEYALVLAGDRVGTPDVLPESVSWLPGDANDGGWAPYTGRSAINESILDFVVLDVELELGLARGGGGWAEITTDCTGQLH